jgi:hypothetical protein
MITNLWEKIKDSYWLLGMAESPLGELAKALVYQQFYDEKEQVIYGRTKSVKVHIPGVGEVVDKFVNEFTAPIELLQNKQYMQYLNQIAANLPIDTINVERKFREAIEKVGDQESAEIFAATYLIGEVLASLRDSEFNNLMEDAKQEAKQRRNFPGSSAIITSRLQQFSAQNDNTVSLLYNLALLRILTIVYGSGEIATTVDKLVRKHLRALVDKIAVPIKPT